MDIIINTINDLLEQREELLKQKEKNKERIKECESKIEYYRWCYNWYEYMISCNNKNIESYNRILKYSKRSHSLFEIPGLNSYNEDFIDNRILDFKLEIKKLTKDKESLKKPLGLYESLRKALLIKQNDIDEKLTNIETTINRLEEKPKVKTKGEIKW